MNAEETEAAEEKFLKDFEKLQSGFEALESKAHDLYGLSVGLCRDIEKLEAEHSTKVALWRAKKKLLKGMRLFGVPE